MPQAAKPEQTPEQLDAQHVASDSESELSESSEEPSSESSSEDESDVEESKSTAEAKQQARRGKSDGITNLRAGQGQKPIMRINKDDMGPDIRDFLKDFLPQLKAANEELVAHRKAGTLKSREIDMVDAPEEEEYIEMDLGLGVLEEKNPSADDSSDSDSDESMADGDDKETDRLRKLMGQNTTKKAPVIQEVHARSS